MQRQYYVGPEGPKTATLAIVAEKPGRNELDELLKTGVGRPLIGRSGQMVDRHLENIGTNRSKVYLTNAVKKFDSLGNPTKQDIIDELPDLYAELASLPNLNCVVAMGNIALLALTNFHYGDISKRRGSIMRSFMGTKMVGTYHPAFYMRGQWELASVVEFDLHRALQESLTRDLNLPTRHFYLEPTLDDLYEWRAKLKGASYISFDIETTRRGHIRCIAFSDHESRAYCIPFSLRDRSNYWDTREREIIAWKIVQEILSQPGTIYVTQNGLFDCWFLRKHGIVTPYMDLGFDTRYAHALLAADLKHDLGFISSTYTREPYYKDESGKWDNTQTPVPDEQFWGYNCKDACVTLEAAKGIWGELSERDQLDYFRRTDQAQWSAVMDMRVGGMRVSPEKLREIQAKLTQDRMAYEEELRAIWGFVPNTKSPSDMQHILTRLQIPYFHTKTGRIKLDKESLIQYINLAASGRGHPDAVPQLGAILEINSKRTLESSFIKMALDANSFYHPELVINGAVSGRFTAKGADEGGPQIQNIPKSIRKAFVPDDDTSLIWNADLKQAESMIVAWEADDTLLINTFLQGKDVHRVRACLIFRNWTDIALPPEELLASILVVCPRCLADGQYECNHSERYTAKESGHAFTYLMGAQKYVNLQAKKRNIVTLIEAKRIKAAVLSPSIIAWQDRGSADLRRSRWQENALGRKRNFFGIFDEELVRAYLSWRAQSCVADVVKRATKTLYRTLPKGSRLLTQTHDSLTLSVRHDHETQVSRLIDEAFYIPMQIHGRELVIPIEKTCGPTWGDQKKVA